MFRSFAGMLSCPTLFTGEQTMSRILEFCAKTKT